MSLIALQQKLTSALNTVLDLMRVQNHTVVERFIFTNLHYVRGERIRFTDFYRAFIESLPKGERKWWTKQRVSRALPPQFPAGHSTANQVWVGNLASKASDHQPFTYVREDGYLRKKCPPRGSHLETTPIHSRRTGTGRTTPRKT